MLRLFLLTICHTLHAVLFQSMEYIPRRLLLASLFIFRYA